MSGANIMEATYGIKVLPEDDPFIELAEAGQEAVSKCAIGFYLVEVFPLRTCSRPFRMRWVLRVWLTRPNMHWQSDTCRRGSLARASSGRRPCGTKLRPASCMSRMRTTCGARFVFKVTLLGAHILTVFVQELGKAGECMAKALAEAYGTDNATVRCAKMATATMYMGPSSGSLA